MPENNTDVEVARITSKANIVGVIIGGIFGVVIAIIPLSDRAFALFQGNLPPSICTTEDGEIGRVRITTNIFNADRSSHAHSQEHPSSEPGAFVISDKDVSDIEDVTSNFRAKRWGARWICIA